MTSFLLISPYVCASIVELDKTLTQFHIIFSFAALLTITTASTNQTCVNETVFLKTVSCPYHFMINNNTRSEVTLQRNNFIYFIFFVCLFICLFQSQRRKQK